MFSDIKSDYAPLLPVSIEEIARECTSNNQLIIEELKSTTEHLLNRYEDLTVNPELVLKKVCKHLYMPYEDIMLNYYLHTDKPDDFQKWEKKIIGRYNSDLSAIEIIAFESLAFQLLQSSTTI